MKTIFFAAVALLAVTGSARAEIAAGEVDRLSQAAAVARETRPLIPDADWDRARCVAVVPKMKAGDEFGKGVMSCRSGDGWSAPVFLQVARGSVQTGPGEVDLVMLVMNVQQLLRDNTSPGAGASLTTGTPDILAFSRAKGVFASVNVSGGVLRSDDKSNRDAYGAGATPSTVLATRSLSAPTEASAFLQALGSVTTPSAAAAVAPTSAASTASATDAVASQPTVRSSNTAPDTDSNLRTMIVAMQQSIDNMLAGQSAAAIGTSGQSGTGGPMASVSRERLEQLRKQLDALLAALNARGQ
jgi:lipid-binding SYLF domain-containing protein